MRRLPVAAILGTTCGLAACAITVGVAAAELTPEDFQQAGEFPWYDAQQKAIVPVEVSPERPPRQSADWEWSTRSAGSNWHMGSWDAFWRGLQYLVWVALAGGLGYLIYLWLAAAARQRLLEQGGFGGEDEHDRRREADLIEQLPFQVKRPLTDLLGEARRLYAQGNYREAIIYLFSYQLVELDRNHKIQLSKGKTNRQYVAEIRGQRSLRQLLTQTMLAFEDVFFGDYDLDRARFETCWGQLEQFNELAQDTTRVAD